MNIQRNKKIHISPTFILYSIFLIPAIASAAFGGVISLENAVIGIIKLLTPFAFGLAIVFFFYGMVMYVRQAGDPKKVAEGKSIMIYGVIAIAVMASVGALLLFIGGNLGIQTPVKFSPATIDTPFSPCDVGYTRSGSQCVPE